MNSFFKEIFEHLSRHKLRTTLTGFAVGWGVLLLIFLLGIGSSFESGLRSSSNGFNSADLRLFYGITDKPFAGFERGRNLICEDSDIPLIKRVLPNLRNIYKTASYFGKELRTAQHYYSENFKIEGIHQGMFASNLSLEMLEGRKLTPQDYNRAKHHYIIPDKVAIALFPKENKVVGKQIIIDGILGTIIGVYKKENHGVSSIYLPYSEICFRKPSIVKDNTLLALDFGGKTFSEEEVNSIEKNIREALSRKRSFDPSDDNAVYLNSWNVRGAKSFDNFFRGIDIFLWLVGLSILTIGIVGVSNIMLVTISERRREIGIRKALGARSKHLIQMILGESIIITLVSGFLGLLLGIGILLTLDYFIATFAIGSFNIFGITIHLLGKVSISVNLGFLAIAIMLIAGIIAGYRPARKATNIPAVEAMSDKTE